MLLNQSDRDTPRAIRLAAANYAISLGLKLLPLRPGGALSNPDARIYIAGQAVRWPAVRASGRKPRARLNRTMQNILLVEDNPLNVKVVEAILEGTEYRLLVAQTGEQALSLAYTHQPVVVLMDIQLPRMDGLTALQHLRGDPQTRSMKVIAVTAMAMKGDRERLLAAGFDGYVSKPFTVQELLAAVRAAVS